MKHTPALYDTIFNLDERFSKALQERDSSGKRRTFRLIHQHLTKYLGEVDAYLATPIPDERHVPYLSPREQDLPWIQRGRYQKYQLQRELQEI